MKHQPFVRCRDSRENIVKSLTYAGFANEEHSLTIENKGILRSTYRLNIKNRPTFPAVMIHLRSDYVKINAAWQPRTPAPQMQMIFPEQTVTAAELFIRVQ